MKVRRRARAMLWRRAWATRWWRQQARRRTAGCRQRRPLGSMWRQVGMIKAHESIETSAGAKVQGRFKCEGTRRKSGGRGYWSNQNFPKWETRRKEPPENSPTGSRICLRDGDVSSTKTKSIPRLQGAAQSTAARRRLSWCGTHDEDTAVLRPERGNSCPQFGNVFAKLIKRQLTFTVEQDLPGHSL